LCPLWCTLRLHPPPAQRASEGRCDTPLLCESNWFEGFELPPWGSIDDLISEDIPDAKRLPATTTACLKGGHHCEEASLEHIVSSFASAETAGDDDSLEATVSLPLEGDVGAPPPPFAGLTAARPPPASAIDFDDIELPQLPRQIALLTRAAVSPFRRDADNTWALWVPLWGCCVLLLAEATQHNIAQLTSTIGDMAGLPDLLGLRCVYITPGMSMMVPSRYFVSVFAASGACIVQWRFTQKSNHA